MNRILRIAFFGFLGLCLLNWAQQTPSVVFAQTTPTCELFVHKTADCSDQGTLTLNSVVPDGNSILDRCHAPYSGSPDYYLINSNNCCQSGQVLNNNNGVFTCVDGSATPPTPAPNCGTVFAGATPPHASICNCSSGKTNFKKDGQDLQCCGWIVSKKVQTKGGVVFVDYCSATVDGAPPAINPTSGVDKSTINALNPLMIAGSTQSTQLSTPGGIVSRMLSFIFPLAGLILFVMITWGGFEMILGATNGQKGLEAGKNRVTSAIVGFILLFCTYWLAQILEVVFGIKIL